MAFLDPRPTPLYLATAVVYESDEELSYQVVASQAKGEVSACDYSGRKLLMLIKKVSKQVETVIVCHC